MFKNVTKGVFMSKNPSPTITLGKLNYTLLAITLLSISINIYSNVNFGNQITNSVDNLITNINNSNMIIGDSNSITVNHNDLQFVVSESLNSTDNVDIRVELIDANTLNVVETHTVSYLSERYSLIERSSLFEVRNNHFTRVTFFYHGTHNISNSFLVPPPNLILTD